MDKIRLTESQLHAVIKESVGRVLNEMGYGSNNGSVKIYEEFEINGEYVEVTLDVDYSDYGDELEINDVRLSDDNDLSPMEFEYVTNSLDQWVDENYDNIYDKVVDKLSEEADYREGLADDYADIRGREMRHPELR